MTGVVNTPLLLQLASYIGAIYLAGWTMREIKEISNSVKEFSRFRNETVKEIHNIKLNCTKNHK